MDEYSSLVWEYSPGSFTGKPITTGWSQGRNTATAQGGIYVLQKILELEWEDLKWKTVIIQWAWNAGLIAAELLSDLWAIIIWISDSKGSIINDYGINICEIAKLKKQGKSVLEYSDIHTVEDEKFLTQACDILVPAALENQITTKNVSKIKAKIILELANGPIAPEADESLFKKDCMVIPDILANAGWVLVSYFEQVQNNQNYYWDSTEINTKLFKKITDATHQVYSKAKDHKTHLRNAAYMISIQRILDAMKDRGEI